MIKRMDTDRRREIGNRLYQIRNRKWLRQEEMAKILGVSLIMYRRAEQGREEISASSLMRIMQNAELLENGVKTKQSDELRHREKAISYLRRYMLFPIADPSTCCFCGKPLGTYDRHNPDPACTLNNAFCCGNCDRRIVQPARIAVHRIIGNALRKMMVTR